MNNLIFTDLKDNLEKKLKFSKEYGNSLTKIQKEILIKIITDSN